MQDNVELKMALKLFKLLIMEDQPDRLNEYLDYVKEYSEDLKSIEDEDTRVLKGIAQVEACLKVLG